jgi:putative membrane protein
MMYGYDLNGAGGWWMVAAMAIVAVAVIASVWLIVHRPGAAWSHRSSAEETLRERYARGELTGEQFDEAKKRLA